MLHIPCTLRPSCLALYEIEFDQFRFGGDIRNPALLVQELRLPIRGQTVATTQGH